MGTAGEGRSFQAAAEPIEFDGSQASVSLDNGGPAGKGRSSGVTGLWCPRLTATDKTERRGEHKAGSHPAPCRP